MSLLTKKSKPTEEDLSLINKEIALYTQFENDLQSESIKRLFSVLDETEKDTIKIFMSTDMESFDNEVKMIFFLASIRSKLQVINSIKNKYLKAKEEKDKLLVEYNKIVSG